VPPRLSLDVTSKPLIQLVWYGARSYSAALLGQSKNEAFGARRKQSRYLSSNCAISPTLLAHNARHTTEEKAVAGYRDVRHSADKDPEQVPLRGREGSSRRA
jgi:hypothetical protein